MINPNLVPLVAASDLFNDFVNGSSIKIRSLTPADPIYYQTLNRPLNDLSVRQLIMAKTISNSDQVLNYRLRYPYLVQPKITGSNIPLGLIWDMKARIPSDYYNLRVAYVVRIDGTNPATWLGASTPYTGTLRFVFAANRDGDPADYQMFHADYNINNTAELQRSRFSPIYTSLYGTLVNPTTVDATIADNIAGQVTFSTLDQDDVVVRSFYDAVPPTGEYALLSADIDSYNPYPLSFGSGLLCDGAYTI